MVRLACAFAIISFVRHNRPLTGGNVIQSDFVRANRLFTGGDDISVVEVTKIWTVGKTEPFEPLLLDPWLPTRLRQIHFGSQCATESVYRYLPAKVELKKSHLGKQSRTECALRHLPCQSEFAEAPWVGNTPEGTDAGIIGLRSLKIKRCAELDGAARLRLTFALIRSVRPNRYSTEERHSQVKNEARCKTTHLKSWCEKHITKPIARLLLAEEEERFVEGDGLRDVESAISGAT